MTDRIWMPNFGFVGRVIHHWLDTPERKLRIAKLEREIAKLDNERAAATGVTDPAVAHAELIEAVSKLVHEVAGISLQETRRGLVLIREVDRSGVPQLQSQLGHTVERFSRETHGVQAEVIWEDAEVLPPAEPSELDALAARIAARRSLDGQ